MSFLHFYSFSRLKVLLVAVLALQLTACLNVSGSDGGVNPNPSPISDNNSVINMLGLTWTAPSEREDGTALSLSEIAGYRIYYGVEAGNYQNEIDINDITADQTQVADLASGTYHVVMTTIDTDGRESSYSPEVVITL